MAGKQQASPTNPTHHARAQKPKNMRADQWRPKFLEHLKNSGNVRYSAEQAGVNYDTVYVHRRKSPDFAAQWETAIEQATDVLEAEARRRAVVGVTKERYLAHNGRLVKDDRGNPIKEIERTYSDRLLELLLKAHRPEKYAERSRVDMTIVIEQVAEQLAQEFGLSPAGKAQLIDLATRRKSA